MTQKESEEEIINSLAGKTLDDLANEIQEGRFQAADGIARIARAYAEGLRRFSKAEEFFKTDHRTRWITKRTKEMLRMVANNDLDPRVVLIPDHRLVDMIKAMPTEEQTDLLDANPYIRVYDRETGREKVVSYTEITSSQSRIAYDEVNRRFRSVDEQATVLKEQEKAKAVAKEASDSWKPYVVLGSMIHFNRKCDVGIHELVGILESLGYKVTPQRRFK